MRIPLSWIKEYVPVKLPPKELARKLTLAGVEVKGIETPPRWENVFVGQITELLPHPNADRLKIAVVNLGFERLEIVCGAPNVEPGDKVPVAKPGAKIFDPRTGRESELRPAEIRGVLSAGMICSERELGISESHEGAMILPPDAPVGAPLAQYLEDAIFDLDITPNRPDLLSVVGIAREISALTGEPLKLPEISYPERGEPARKIISAAIEDPKLCSRYCAALIRGVRVGPSPSWLRERLEKSGIKPLNNIVDVTNYVTLEWGQPIHAFDFRTLRGGGVAVRRARRGERITTLDGEERELDEEILVIADEERPVALAGIMGGLATAVSEETEDVLLESANFNPSAVRRGALKLGLRTEASTRFEKGLSPELPPLALRRAAQLILEIAGGEASRGIIDLYPGREERKPLKLSLRRMKQVLGVKIPLGQVVRALDALGFECRKEGTGKLAVSIPWWRTDIKIEEDLIEEVARIVGYDKIPPRLLPFEIPRSTPDRKLLVREAIRDLLAGMGLQEVITYSLVSRRLLELCDPEGRFGPPLKVANPLSQEQEFLRTNLRPGLLSALSRNARIERGSFKLFEIGRTFHPKPGDLPEERERAAGILAGLREPLGLHSPKPQELDFFDAKGVVEELLLRLGIEASFEPSSDSFLSPGRTALVKAGRREIGLVGEIHPRILRELDLPFEVAGYFELDLGRLYDLVSPPRFSPPSRYQASWRDLSVIVDEEVPAGRLLELVRETEGVARAILYDVYRGEGIPPGKKSLTFRIFYQSPTHTLTDSEINEIQGEILRRIQDLGGKLRGS